jgi:hypothetical protein
MARSIYDVTTHPNGWQVKKRGNASASSVHATKDAAVTAGQTLAKANQPSQLVVHKSDGTFEYEYTYGDDPFPPAG